MKIYGRQNRMILVTALTGIVLTVFFAVRSWQAVPLLEKTGQYSQGYMNIEIMLCNKDDYWAAASGNVGWQVEAPKYDPPPDLGPPGSGGLASISPSPVAGWAYVRWFNYSQQRFYEAVIDDPQMPKRAAAIVRSKPDGRRFSLSLMTGISANGEVKLWLFGTNHSIDVWPYEGRWFTELLGSAQGYEIDGDLITYQDRTQAARTKNLIPLIPDPAPAATQPKRESISDQLYEHRLKQKS